METHRLHKVLTLITSTGLTPGSCRLLFAFFVLGSLYSPAFADKPVLPPTIFERLKPMEKAPAKIVFPSVLDPVQDVIVTMTATNSNSILELAQVMAKIQSKARLVVLTPESFDPLVGKQKSRVDQLQKLLQRDLGKAVAQQIPIEFHAMPYLQYSWPQDLGKFFYFQDAESKKWRLGFFDLNRGNRNLKSERWPVDSKQLFKDELPLEEPQLVVDRLKSLLKFEILRLPNITREFADELSVNHGANVEIAPGGFAIVGTSAPPEMRAPLEQGTGHPALQLETGFSQSGLLNVNYALVPSGTPCGISLLVASPLLGLQARQNESSTAAEIKLKEFYAETLFYFAKSAKIKIDASMRSADFDLHREARRYVDREASETFVGQIRYLDFVVLKTLKAEAEIEKSVAIAQSYFKTQKICGSLAVIRVPVLAQVVEPGEYFEDENGVGTDSRLQYYSPITNLLVIDGHLIMGDFKNTPGNRGSELKTMTQKALTEGRVPRDRQHFISSDFYNEGLGSIGSAALIRRRPVTIPPESPAKSE